MSEKSTPKRPPEDVVTVKRTGRPDTLETLSGKRALPPVPKPAGGR